MKTILTLILGMVVQLSLLAADTLDSKITQATVFLSGAQIFRETGQVYIPKGIHKLVIKSVSPQLNPNSIQATSKGNFMILDVQHKIRHFEPQKDKPVIMPVRIQKEINQLEDSLIIVQFELERINQKLSYLKGERDMILKNKLMTGGGKSDSLPVLKDAIRFYREKLDEIENIIYNEKLHQYKILAIQSGKKERLDELKQYNQNIKQPEPEIIEEHDIVVTTYAETDTRGTVGVNYLVTNAGWIPSYDLRANNTDEPMKITYKAQVYQNSGEEWKDVKLVLSTYNHNLFTTKPQLGVWRLDYYIPGSYYNQYRGANFSSQVEMQSFVQKRSITEEQIERQQFISYEEITEINKSFSNVEFEIKLPYSVPSDGEKILMVVNNHSVNADFYHYMIPRVSNNGYMMAKINEWETLNFLPGTANIYFRNTYVGQTEIDPMILKDTMELAIGRDQQVISTRKKLKDEEKGVNFGKRIVRTFTFEIMVRNNSSSTITLDIEDQIPVSANDDIEVELLDKADADYTEKTGKLNWNMTLKPGEVRKIKFSYSVEHDKNKRIS